MWSKKYCDNSNLDLGEVISTFLEYIQFHKVPATILMKDIRPLGIVPDHIIMNALAYQADPSSVEPCGSRLSPKRARRLPVQSSLDPYGSSTTLSSSTSSDINSDRHSSDGKHSSEGGYTGSPLGRIS